LELDPRFVEARNNIANFHIKRNELDKALPLLLEALAIRSNFPEARYNLACYLAMKGDYASSMEQLRLALVGRSHYPEVNLMLGNLLLQSGNPKEAVPHLQEGLKIYPNDPLIRSNLGSAYSELGEEEEAFRELEKALQLAPTNPAYMNNLAWVLATSTNQSIRNGPRAVFLSREALKLTGAMDAARFLYTLAAAYAAEGQFNTAINTAKEARRLAREQGNRPLEASLGEMILEYQVSESKNLPPRTP
jgi:Flp pilus assembly protein TadD